MHFGFAESRAGKPAFVLLLFVPSLVFAAIGVVRAHREGGVLYQKASFDSDGRQGWFAVQSGDFSRGFAGAALLFGLAWAFTRVVTPNDSKRLLWLGRLYEQIGDANALRQKLAWVIAAIVVMAAVEELVWRGLVTSLLASIVGSSRAWIWSAVLYSLAHVPTIWALSDKVAGPNPILPLAALVCGLAWGYMARRFGRLMPSFFSHVLFDWTVVMMFRLWGPGV